MKWRLENPPSMEVEHVSPAAVASMISSPIVRILLTFLLSAFLMPPQTGKIITLVAYLYQCTTHQPSGDWQPVASMSLFASLLSNVTLNISSNCLLEYRSEVLATNFGQISAQNLSQIRNVWVKVWTEQTKISGYWRQNLIHDKSA